MVGVIRKRDVLAHPMATVRCFGWRVFARTLVAGRRETFLSVLMTTGFFRTHPVNFPEVVERCGGLETAAARIYSDLAGKFAGDPEAALFFAALAEQEREHAEILELCRAARGPWDPRRIDPCREIVSRLEKAMAEAEAAAAAATAIPDALRLVLRIESSEVNSVFQAIVAASGSGFVREMDAFRTATRQHLEYIRDRIPEMEPALEKECRSLVDGSPAPALQGRWDRA